MISLPWWNRPSSLRSNPSDGRAAIERKYASAATRIRRDYPEILALSVKVIDPAQVGKASLTGVSWAEALGVDGPIIEVTYRLSKKLEGFGTGATRRYQTEASASDDAYDRLGDGVFGAAWYGIKTGQKPIEAYRTGGAPKPRAKKSAAAKAKPRKKGAARKGGKRPISDREIRRKYESGVKKLKAKGTNGFGIITAALYKAYGKRRVQKALEPVRAKAKKKAAKTRAAKKNRKR